MNRIVAAILAVGSLWVSARAAAQCSFGGTPLYKGCFGIGWAGCCTYKETQLGTITTLQWCENGFLCSLICNPFSSDTFLCGWVVDPATGQGLYDCTSAQTADPSGQFPYFCSIPCGDISLEGCCEGQTLLKYCKNGSLNFINCSANSEGYRFCGWDPVMQAYTCTHAPIPGPEGHPYACGSSVCVPNCAGKQCGPDGCGGSCGTCAVGKTCGSDGVCGSGPCVPDCAGKDCGPDGCGGSCGQCGGTLVCNESQKCVGPPCHPDCTNKQCGPDLCGGSCGVCAPPKECSIYFQCVAPGEDVPLMPESGADAHVVPSPAAEDTGGGAPVETAGMPRAGARVCPDGTVLTYGRCATAPPAAPVAAGSQGSAGCRAAARPAEPLLFWLIGWWMIRRISARRGPRTSSEERGEGTGNQAPDTGFPIPDTAHGIGECDRDRDRDRDRIHLDAMRARSRERGEARWARAPELLNQFKHRRW